MFTEIFSSVINLLAALFIPMVVLLLLKISLLKDRLNYEQWQHGIIDTSRYLTVEQFEDIVVNNISFDKELYNEVLYDLSPHICKECLGSGIEYSFKVSRKSDIVFASLSACKYCNGTGDVRNFQDSDIISSYNPL